MTLSRRCVIAGLALSLSGLTACGGSRDEGAEPSGSVPFSFDVAFRTTDPGALVVRYGDSGSCPRTAVDAQVRESPAEVVVMLTSDPPDPGPCTADYAARDVTIRLDAPLADRRVVDGASGTEVAVATGTPPGPQGSPVPLPTG